MLREIQVNGINNQVVHQIIARAIETNDYVSCQYDNLTVEASLYDGKVTIEFIIETDGIYEKTEFLYSVEFVHEVEFEDVIKQQYTRINILDKYQVYEYYVPVRFISFITYGDVTELNDDDLVAIDEFYSMLNSAGKFGEKYFQGLTSSNDIDGSSCDTYLVEYLVAK